MHSREREAKGEDQSDDTEQPRFCSQRWVSGAAYMGRYMLVAVMIIYLFPSLTSSQQWCTLQLQAGKMQRATGKKCFDTGKISKYYFFFKRWRKKNCKKKKRRDSFISSSCSDIPNCQRNTKLKQSQSLFLHPRSVLWPWLSKMTRGFNCLWLMNSDTKLLKISCYTCCTEMWGFASCCGGENPKCKPFEPPYLQNLAFCPEIFWARN